MSRRKIVQFRFAVTQEGGGEHVMTTIAKALKAATLSFLNTTRNKNIEEICDEVSKQILIKRITIEVK